ncbi:type III secretion system cytoplasmic ring protein SctQ [Pseudaminobacter sp. 19-2017]|uniref:Type III secretion system cytoplasmic ring protein SctQ n=1 Tax=Pseudaminobacter soli (ex Zhang et al. 2022) TaxID=2831468 RepID=A0A942DXK3_9HYPH|nr:type III secretion system cytoplasmic ring protein SctQ [Pseudaminobacter soli]MBS3647171.1 type III secretion system cytoplasmic ring protein SctQ [Pseudaminobacter soli]
MLKPAPPSLTDVQLRGPKSTQHQRTRLSRTAFEWEPLELERVSLQDLEAPNAYYGCRPAIRFELGGIAVTATAKWRLDEALAWDTAVIVAFGDAEASLHVNRSLLVSMLARQNLVADLDQLNPAHAALLIEALVAQELTDFEDRLGRPVELKAVAFEPSSAADAARFQLVLHHADGTPMGLLRFESEDIALALARLLDAFAQGLAPEAVDPLLSLRICRGAVRITLAELDNLVPGDVVVIDDTPEQSVSAMIELSGLLAAPVEFAGSGVRLRDRLRRLQGSRWEWMMSSGQMQSFGEQPEDLDVSDLPVTLVFEAGRATLSVEQVRKLAPGAILPLPDAAADSINIISGGKRIGQGELVEIGESLGVRVRRVFTNG